MADWNTIKYLGEPLPGPHQRLVLFMIRWLQGFNFEDIGLVPVRNDVRSTDSATGEES